MTYHYYLPPAQQTELSEVLRNIPRLAEDLAVAMTTGALRGASNQPRVSTGDKPQPLPYNPGPSEAATHLRNELRRWTEWTLQHHPTLPIPQNTLTSMAAWLDGNLRLLAILPGSENAAADIRTEYQAAVQASGKTDDTPHTPPKAHLDEARNLELSASGVATAAKELGEWGHGLTRRRVNNLRTLGHITPVRVAGKIPVYKFGDVIDAHLTVQTRNTG